MSDAPQYGWGDGLYSNDVFLTRLAGAGMSIMPKSEVLRIGARRLVYNPHEERDRPHFALAHTVQDAMLVSYFRVASEDMRNRLDVPHEDLVIHQRSPKNIISMRDCPVWLDDRRMSGQLYEHAKAIEMQTDRYRQIQRIAGETRKSYALVVGEEPVFGVPEFSSSFAMLDMHLQIEEQELYDIESSPEIGEIIGQAHERYQGTEADLVRRVVVAYQEK